MPSWREVHELMRHPHGVTLLATILLVNYSSAFAIASIPVSAETVGSFDASWQGIGVNQRLERRYRAETPALIAEYLAARGAFAAHVADGTATADEASGWQARIHASKEQLIGMNVSSALMEVHLGLVVALGLDEVAAGELMDSYREGGAGRQEAEAAFSAAEDRLTMVLLSTPWLVMK